jgi:receptor protein-tyrosine kinase
MRSHLMLRWFDGDTARKTLAIMSPEPKEGRSFIAANLAVAFSQLGERVLLVDADFRNPVQHLLFGLENRTGLSAVISARQSAADIERIPGLEHLSVLPAGPTPPNPVELLSLAAFPDLLEDFRNRFDLILIDSPPAAQYADAQIISARVSAVVFVVRKNATKALRARTTLENLRNHTTILGTVLNDF